MMPLTDSLSTVVPVVVALNLILLVILTLVGRKAFFKLIRKINRKTWLMLLAIFLMGFIFRMWYFPHYHQVYINEFWYMEAGKNTLQHGKLELCNYVDVGQKECGRFPGPAGWPVFISFVYLFFGLSNMTVLKASAVVGSLSVILIFVLGYLLTQRNEIGIFSAALLSFMPFHIKWSTHAMNNSFAIFFVLLTLTLFFVYVKTDSFALHLAAVLSFLYTIQIRVEYILLILPVTLIYLYYGKRVFRKKSFYLAWLLNTVFFLSYLIQVSWKASDPGNREFGLALLTNQLAEVFASLISHGLVPLLIFLLAGLGAVLMLVKNLKLFLFNAAWFLIFLLFYCSWERSGQTRYFLIAVVPLIFFCAFGLHYLLARLPHVKKYHVVIGASLVFVIFLPAHQPVRAITEYNGYQYFESRLIERIEKDVNDSCYIIMQWPTILHSTTRLKGIPTQQVIDNPQLVDRINEQAGCLLHFQDIFCYKMEDYAKANCETILTGHNTSTHIRYSWDNVHYALYAIQS